MALSIAAVDATRTERNNFKLGIINDDNTLTVTDQTISNVNVIGFVCANSQCSDVSGRLWGGQTLTSQGNEITLEYPEQLQSPHGYGIFMFKEGYFPYEINADYAGKDDSDPQGPFTNILTKKQNCYANITDFTVNQREGILSVYFQVANTSFSLISPVDYNTGAVGYNPIELKDLLSVDVDVKVKLTKDGQLYEERFVREMNPSEKRSESFEFTVNPGNYTVEVSSLPNDIKCLNSQERKESKELSIAGVEVPNNLPYPSLRILSPENGKTYADNSILLELEAINATEVWYSVNNGANVIYTGQQLVTFPSGEVSLRAFAKNAQGVLVNASIAFRVAPIIPGDTTPPAPISNLTLTSRTESTLSWSWVNPSDLDFDHVLISIGGSTAIMATGNSYTATGLNANTSYIITVYTVDTSENSNKNGVSRTDTTLARQVVVGDDNDEDEDDDNDGIRRIISEDDFLDDELSNKPSTTSLNRRKITLDTENNLKDSKGKVSLSWNTWSLIFLIGSFILLIVLLIVALSRLKS